MGSGIGSKKRRYFSPYDSVMHSKLSSYAGVRCWGESCYNSATIKMWIIISLMKLFSKYCLLLLCAVFMMAAKAGQPGGLYAVVVPVASQSSGDLRKATASGLKTAFIRVSGRADVAQYKEIQAALGSAQVYLKQYSYQRDRDAALGTEQLQLLLEFERAQVDKQLRVAGLPHWSSKRPSVLLWLVVEDGKGRRIVGTELSPEIVMAIQRHATRRGLPVELPLLDLEDNAAVSTEALWQLDRQQAEQVSRRYQPDTLLIGRASQLSNGQWLGRWRFIDEGQVREFELQAADVNDYVGQAIDTVTAILSAQYAIAPVSIAEEGVLMRLSGIKSFSDYARAIRYLEGLTAIRDANVINIDGEVIIIRLFAEGQLQQLELVLARDKKLLPISALVLPEYTIALNYQWPDPVDSELP